MNITNNSTLFILDWDDTLFPTTWFFNDIEIKGSAKYKIEFKYPLINLTINKTDLIHIGKYRVTIFAERGSACVEV